MGRGQTGLQAITAASFRQAGMRLLPPSRKDKGQGEGYDYPAFKVYAKPTKGKVQIGMYMIHYGGMTRPDKGQCSNCGLPLIWDRYYRIQGPACLQCSDRRIPVQGSIQISKTERDFSPEDITSQAAYMSELQVKAANLKKNYQARYIHREPS